MYDSEPRPTEGKPIEEVLPAAINATATSEKVSRAGQSALSGSRSAGELARRQSSDESSMAVMRARSVTLRLPALSGGLLVGAAFVVVLLVLAVVLI